MKRAPSNVKRWLHYRPQPSRWPSVGVVAATTTTGGRYKGRPRPSQTDPPPSSKTNPLHHQLVEIISHSLMALQLVTIIDLQSSVWCPLDVKSIVKRGNAK